MRPIAVAQNAIRYAPNIGHIAKPVATNWAARSGVQHGFYARPAAHVGSLATAHGLGTIPRSSDIVRFVQGGVVKTFRWQTQINQIVTFYKLTTIRPCPADVFLEFVRSRGADAVDDGTCNPLEFTDGTGSIYRIKFTGDRAAGYVSIDGTVIPAPEQTGVLFGHVSRFIAFVGKNDLGLRCNGVEQPAHDGFLLSDIHHCEAYRQAEHAAMHPKDQS